MHTTELIKQLGQEHTFSIPFEIYINGNENWQKSIPVYFNLKYAILQLFLERKKNYLNFYDDKVVNVVG